MASAICRLSGCGVGLALAFYQVVVVRVLSESRSYLKSSADGAGDMDAVYTNIVHCCLRHSSQQCCHLLFSQMPAVPIVYGDSYTLVGLSEAGRKLARPSKIKGCRERDEVKDPYTLKRQDLR